MGMVARIRGLQERREDHVFLIRFAQVMCLGQRQFGGPIVFDLTIVFACAYQQVEVLDDLSGFLVN